MKILVTGGAGYIGSHTVCALLKQGDEVVIVDNLCNSKIEVLKRIEKICGKNPTFYQISVQDEVKLDEVFSNEHVDAIIHFAGLKSVGESVLKPDLYYSNNVGSSEVLIKLMKKHHVKNIVFSSSATVYGTPKRVPLYESDPIGGCTNPYGETKVVIEKMLQEEAKKDSSLNVAILRYFNPIGAHPSGLIGEDPQGIPNNLMPYITQVACKKLECLNVFGNDYDTVDGTGVRDYIHVMDLADGHLAALNKLYQNPGLVIYNLGTGKGTSVLELIHAFEKANNLIIPYVIKPRRPGDIATSYANADKAYQEMKWKAKYNIIDCCKDAWNWQKNNPNGYN